MSAAAVQAAEGKPVSVTETVPADRVSEVAARLVWLPAACMDASGLEPPLPAPSCTPRRGRSHAPLSGTARAAGELAGSAAEKAHISIPSTSGCAVPITQATGTASGVVGEAGSTPVLRSDAVAAALQAFAAGARAAPGGDMSSRGISVEGLPDSAPVCAVLRR